MPRNREITAFGDIPDSKEFVAPVLVAIEMILNNIVPKLPNLVSNPFGPL
jgi:hypothetical protein